MTDGHFIEATVHVPLRMTDAGWVIDLTGGAGYEFLNQPVWASERFPMSNEGCHCDDGDDCEAALAHAQASPLPTGAELLGLAVVALNADPAVTG